MKFNEKLLEKKRLNRIIAKHCFWKIPVGIDSKLNQTGKLYSWTAIIK